jgi:chitin synthase
MVSTLIGPATVIMMISGAYVTVFKLELLTSYALALSPAIIYTILCFTVKAKYQIMTAEIFSALYSFIMMVVFVGTIITAAQESPFHPSVIFLSVMVVIFVFAAMLHPWEFSCIIYGALYFLCVPSGFLLLVIYSLCNMNVVSWGTREVPKRKTKKEIEKEEKERKEKEEKKKQGWFSQFMPKFQLQDLRAFMDISKKEDKSADILEQMNNLERLILDSKGKSELTEVLIDKKGILNKPRRFVTFSEETQIEVEAEQKRTEEDEYLYQKEKKKRNDLVNPKWLEIEEFHPGTVVQMNNEENTFWENFIKK